MTTGDAAYDGPRGIGGWLWVLALVQLLLIAAHVVLLLQSKLPTMLVTFPLLALGALVLHLVMIGVVVYVSIELIRGSRRFPRLYAYQWIAVMLFPIIASVWTTGMLSVYTGMRFFSTNLLHPVQLTIIAIQVLVAAALWAILGTYIARSARASNTFVR